VYANGVRVWGHLPRVAAAVFVLMDVEAPLASILVGSVTTRATITTTCRAARQNCGLYMYMMYLRRAGPAKSRAATMSSLYHVIPRLAARYA